MLERNPTLVYQSDCFFGKTQIGKSERLILTELLRVTQHIGTLGLTAIHGGGKLAV
jgi:hypothetical protein